MPIIRINKNSLSGGLKSAFSTFTSSEEAAENEYIVAGFNGIDLHRVGFEGHITPPQVFDQAGVSNAGINSVPRNAVATNMSGIPNVHYILGGLAGIAPKTVLTTSPSSYVSGADITPHGGHNFTTLPSTGFWGEDIILYKIGSTPTVFYSWNDNADGDVGKMATDGSSPDDDYLTTVPTGASGTGFVAGVSHRMVEGADKKLYITNGRYLAQYDGATIDYVAYDVGMGWIITDVRKFGNFLAISSVRSGANFPNYYYKTETQVTLWNMTEPGLGLVYPVADNYISAIYATPENRLFAFTFGRNNTMKLFEFTGQGFKMLWETLTFSTPPDPRGIEIYKGLLTWVSGLFCLAMDLKTNGVHVPYMLHNGSDSIAVAGGFLKNIEQAYLLTSGVASGYGTSILTLSSGYAPASPVHDLRTRVFRLPYKSNIVKIRVYFSQMASGGSATFSLFKNYNTMSVGGAADLLNKILSFSANGAIVEYELLDKVITEVSAFYMNIRVSGQVSISEIEIEYKLQR